MIYTFLLNPVKPKFDVKLQAKPCWDWCGGGAGGGKAELKDLKINR